MPANFKLGIAVGIANKRGYPTTKRVTPSQLKRKARKEKKDDPITQRNEFVKNVVTEVCGMAPWEMRSLDLLEISEKKAHKFVKKRVIIILLNYKKILKKKKIKLKF
jgi:hypothetical protein